MKYFKKLSCIVILLFTLSLVISATNENTYTYDYPELEITVHFSNDSIIPENLRKTIANSIAYDTPLSQTYSLCWLLGHDTTIDTVSAIYHKRSEYDPRCQLEIYHVTVCSKCDYVSPALVSSSYISCCPPEASAVSLD